MICNQIKSSGGTENRLPASVPAKHRPYCGTGEQWLAHHIIALHFLRKQESKRISTLCSKAEHRYTTEMNGIIRRAYGGWTDL
jgi:hypothetical protein